MNKTRLAPSDARRAWHRHVRFCPLCKLTQPCPTEVALRTQIRGPVYAAS